MSHTDSTPGQTTGYLKLITGNPNYRYLWMGEIISLFGDWFNLIASAALVSSLTGSGLAIGGLFVVRMLAPFLISPLAGVAADRFNRKTLLLLSDVTRAIVVIGFLFVRTPQHIWLLYMLTALQLAISGMFFPAKNAILPDIVGRDDLGAANALSSATWSVMLALGAAVGGFVAGQWGIYVSFVIDAITFLVSAGFVLLVRYRPSPVQADSGAHISGALNQFVEGLNFLRSHRDIFMIAIQKALVALTIGGIFQIVQVILAEQVFVIGEGGSTSLGLQYAVVGVGTGIGPIAARLFSGDDDRRLRVMIAWGYALNLIGMALVSPLGSFGLVLIGSTLRGVGTGINWVFSTQLLLQLLPDRVRGRVFSSEFALFTLGSALATGFGGWLFDHAVVSTSTILWGVTAVSVIPGLIWLGWISHPAGRGAAAGTAVPPVTSK